MVEVSKKNEELVFVNMADFLLHAPKDTDVVVTNAWESADRGVQQNPLVPNLIHYCDSEECCHDQTFAQIDKDGYWFIQQSHAGVLTFLCRNCEKKTILWSVWHGVPYTDTNGADPENRIRIIKLGRLSDIHEPMPKRASKLLGKDRIFFFQALKSEREGLGIGAFAYMRRVVESRKDKIFDELIKVSEELKASSELVEELKRAKETWSFTDSVEKMPKLPDALLMKGHNPLKLLHGALSHGLHSLDDKTCLERVRAIREVFFAMAERIDELLKDKEALGDAVDALATIRDGEA